VILTCLVVLKHKDPRAMGRQSQLMEGKAHDGIRSSGVNVARVRKASVTTFALRGLKCG